MGFETYQSTVNNPGPSGDRLRPKLRQGDQERQKILQPPEQEGEVVAGGGQDGVEGVALLAGEVVAAHSVFALDVADDGLDRRPPPHLALDGWGDAALLAGGEDPELVALRCVVAAIAGVGMRPISLPLVFSTSGMTLPSVWPS
ncbi:hypothetical protein A9K71_21275 [Mesorhizobium sp. WSM3873]|nr:hypothetical protein A9K71_21275 [Mesorhizobium sp. WSM3873]